MKTRQLIIAIFFSIISINSFSQDPYIGEIRMFAGNYAPIGWAFCDGQLLPVSENSALFSILGTIYGGDGSTTFGLPDLRGRSAVHEGTGPGLPNIPLGSRGGATHNTLNINHLPNHSHTGYINVSDTKGDDFYTSHGYIADSSTVSFQQFTDTQPIGNKTIQGVQTNSAGNGLSYTKRSPYLGINFIIALQGIYPPRD